MPIPAVPMPTPKLDTIGSCGRTGHASHGPGSALALLGYPSRAS
jgi:hypothetical protein